MAGSATLTRSCRKRIGKPIMYALCGGSRSMRTIPRPDPLTSQRPANPCTPRLSGLSWVSPAAVTAVRENCARNAQPILTRTWSPLISTRAPEGGRNTAVESSPYHRSNRIGNRAAVLPCMSQSSVEIPSGVMIGHPAIVRRTNRCLKWYYRPRKATLLACESILLLRFLPAHVQARLGDRLLHVRDRSVELPLVDLLEDAAHRRARGHPEGDEVPAAQERLGRPHPHVELLHPVAEPFPGHPPETGPPAPPAIRPGPPVKHGPPPPSRPA